MTSVVQINDGDISNQKQTKEPTSLAELELDPSLYKPDPNEIEFFKSQTGIQDDEELKKHIISVQKEAWEVVHYMCIRAFGFTRMNASRLPAYPDLMRLGKERPGAIFVDFACCFGVDTRKVIVDGFPVENVVATDIEPVFWELGHKLFKTAPETFPVPFVQADGLNSQHIAPHAPFYTHPETPRPDPKSLTSLTPLQGHVSAIHATSVFHLFNEDEQLRLARNLASLLSPEPGSIIFGHHAGEATPGPRAFANSRGVHMFCHNAESWVAMWDGVVFEKGTVEVWAKLIDHKRQDLEQVLGERTQAYVLAWHVKRL